MRRNGLKIMIKLFSLIGSFTFFLILAIINGSLGNLLAMGVSVFGGLGIAKVIGEPISLSYELIVVLIISCGVLRGILRYVEQYSNHYIAFKLLAILRDKIFKILRILAPAKLEDKKKGNLISMLTADIETLEVFYAHTISPIFIAIISSASVFIFVMLFSSIYLALTAMLFYLVIGILLPIISSKMLKNSGVKYRAEFSSFNSYFLDSIKGVKEIILNNATTKRKDEVNRRSDNLLKETKNMKQKSATSYGITEILVSVCIIIAFGVGIVLLKNGNVTLGKMIVAVIAISSSFGPVIALSSLPSNLTNTFASADRVIDLVEEKPSVLEITGKNDFEFDNLEISNLSFKYDDKLVLNNININVKKGEVLGIVGPSGCGKSTILKLLLRFYNSKGIKYNGIDINEINTKSLYENVSIVFQNTYLFDDTIKYNLKIAKEDATNEEIIDACKKASIHDFIMSLDDGYDTKVGNTLNNLSAGEKQRLGLARSFLRGSNLILLDEVTSNVDAINEGIILKAIKEQKDKAIIIVSHRESTMKIANRIYHIESGVIE